VGFLFFVSLLKFTFKEAEENKNLTSASLFWYFMLCQGFAFGMHAVNPFIGMKNKKLTLSYLAGSCNSVFDQNVLSHSALSLHHVRYTMLVLVGEQFNPRESIYIRHNLAFLNAHYPTYLLVPILIKSTLVFPSVGFESFF